MNTDIDWEYECAQAGVRCCRRTRRWCEAQPHDALGFLLAIRTHYLRITKLKQRKDKQCR